MCVCVCIFDSMEMRRRVSGGKGYGPTYCKIFGKGKKARFRRKLATSVPNRGGYPVTVYQIEIWERTSRFSGGDWIFPSDRRRSPYKRFLGYLYVRGPRAPVTKPYGAPTPRTIPVFAYVFLVRKGVVHFWGFFPSITRRSRNISYFYETGGFTHFENWSQTDIFTANHNARKQRWTARFFFFS